MPDQTNTNDNFEQALELDGIEIIIPGEDEELPEGVGAGGYSPRLTAPNQTNPYYLKNGYGGYNRCILITGKSCLPNCVGYAHGRLLEIGGVPGDKKLPTCNAEDWLATAKANGLKTGNAPRKGDAIVWQSGKLWNGADGCGHVGVVEEIDNEGRITVSQSNYGGTRFFLTKHYPPYNITGQTFIGFVRNPYIQEEKAGWQKDSKGRWYRFADGTYPKDKWEKIDDNWYHFDSKGYMQTGWILLKGKWYYLQSDGVMLASSWLKYKNEWYFLGKDGAMFVGKHNVPVYFDKEGKFVGNPIV